jgi:WhiB family redox-sensing transcriptional regulator
MREMMPGHAPGDELIPHDTATAVGVYGTAEGLGHTPSYETAAYLARRAGVAFDGILLPEDIPSGDGETATEDWRHEALCRDEDPELFFPIGNSGLAVTQTEAAKAVCDKCPVKTDCQDWALEKGMTGGVWGGLGEEERGRLRHRLIAYGQLQATPIRISARGKVEKSKVS